MCSSPVGLPPSLSSLPPDPSFPAEVGVTVALNADQQGLQRNVFFSDFNLVGFFNECYHLRLLYCFLLSQLCTADK